MSRDAPQEGYRYVRIGKYSVCLDQSMVVAIRTLGLGHRSNGLSSLGVSSRRAWRTIVIIAKCKMGLADPERYMSLPVFGQLAMRVHRGYKVFDFDNSVVTKVFDESIATREAEAEIGACETASAVTAAPRFLGSDPDAAWYKEEYICGTHATDTVRSQSSDYLELYPKVEPCLAELARCQAPVEADTVTHINRLADEAYRERWSALDTRIDDIDGVATYLGDLRSWLLDNSSSRSVQLILTHGDFSLVNAISVEGALKIIDWEGIGPGILFSDLYNFMFAERFYGRTTTEFTAEADTILNRFRDTVLSQCPELEKTATLPKVFLRRLYYLERIRLLLERDISTNLLDVLCKSVSIFKEFDQEMGDSPV